MFVGFIIVYSQVVLNRALVLPRPDGHRFERAATVKQVRRRAEHAQEQMSMC